MPKAIIVFTTTSNAQEAELLAEKIVHTGLGACVQILPQITSVYVWKGKVQKGPEHLLLIKTLPERYEALRSFITANHSYEVPEIVAIDAEKISEQYLAWMKEVISEN